MWAITTSGNFTLNSDKFTVNSSNGNTVVAGTLAVSGAVSVGADGLFLSDGSHNLILKTASDIDTSDKTITFTTGNSDRGITLGGDISTAGSFTTQNNNVVINAVGDARTLTLNESLTVGDGNDGTITFSAASKTLTVENDSTINQDVTSDADVTFATLSVNNSGIKIKDTNASHDLIIAVGSNITADRTLTFTTGDSNRGVILGGDFTTQNNNVVINAVGDARTLTLNESLTVGDGNDGTITFSAAHKTLTVENDSTINQDVTSDADVTFATLSVNNSGIKIKDTNASHDLIIAVGSNITADEP